VSKDILDGLVILNWLMGRTSLRVIIRRELEKSDFLESAFKLLCSVQVEPITSIVRRFFCWLNRERSIKCFHSHYANPDWKIRNAAVKLIGSNISAAAACHEEVFLKISFSLQLILVIYTNIMQIYSMLDDPHPEVQNSTWVTLKNVNRTSKPDFYSTLLQRVFESFYDPCPPEVQMVKQWMTKRYCKRSAVRISKDDALEFLETTRLHLDCVWMTNPEFWSSFRACMNRIFECEGTLPKLQQLFKFFVDQIFNYVRIL
jgi:hypothetical protein